MTTWRKPANDFTLQSGGLTLESVKSIITFARCGSLEAPRNTAIAPLSSTLLQWNPNHKSVTHCKPAMHCPSASPAGVPTIVVLKVSPRWFNKLAREMTGARCATPASEMAVRLKPSRSFVRLSSMAIPLATLMAPASLTCVSVKKRVTLTNLLSGCIPSIIEEAKALVSTLLLTYMEKSVSMHNRLSIRPRATAPRSETDVPPSPRLRTSMPAGSVSAKAASISSEKFEPGTCKFSSVRRLSSQIALMHLSTCSALPCLTVCTITATAKRDRMAASIAL
mmetsp:Transcript_111955/g.311691  ORF Transcript_111955/g.311691 Transcript_111955/m.311691 type:complete len:280 (+) Transcript_111955:140-979(+)